MNELSALKIVIATMAAWQIVETLRHGSLFLWLRQWGNQHMGSSRWVVSKAAYLTNCPFCQSHWAPLVPLVVLGWGPAWMQVLVWSLAITRTAQLLNDLTHGINRSPPSGEEIEEDETEQTKVSSDLTSSSTSPGGEDEVSSIPPNPEISSAL